MRSLSHSPRSLLRCSRPAFPVSTTTTTAEALCPRGRYRVRIHTSIAATRITHPAAAYVPVPHATTRSTPRHACVLVLRSGRERVSLLVTPPGSYVMYSYARSRHTILYICGLDFEVLVWLLLSAVAVSFIAEPAMLSQ